MSKRHARLLATGLIVTLGFAGCGGSGSDEKEAPVAAAGDNGATGGSGQVEPAKPEPDLHQKFLAGIKRRLIPFGPGRKREMADYSARHYGRAEWRLEDPKQIVEHFAVAPTNDSIYNTFAGDSPDPELGELPNVCAHFAVGGDGEIIQMVKLNTRCRHTVGLNYTTFGIEHVGYSDEEVLGNRAEIRSSLKLTQALRCEYGIAVRDVIGHNESLGSRFHKELDPALQGQTHGDFAKASMDRYRAELKRLGPC